MKTDADKQCLSHKCVRKMEIEIISPYLTVRNTIYCIPKSIKVELKDYHHFHVFGVPVIIKKLDAHYKLVLFINFLLPIAHFILVCVCEPLQKLHKPVSL